MHPFAPLNSWLQVCGWVWLQRLFSELVSWFRAFGRVWLYASLLLHWTADSGSIIGFGYTLFLLQWHADVRVGVSPSFRSTLNSCSGPWLGLGMPAFQLNSWFKALCWVWLNRLVTLISRFQIFGLLRFCPFFRANYSRPLNEKKNDSLCRLRIDWTVPVASVSQILY